MRCAHILIALSLLVIAQSSWASAVTVQGLRIWRAPDHTRLVFDLSGSVDHKVFFLEKETDQPERLVVDISNTVLVKSIDNVDFSSTPVTKLRAAPKDNDTLRVVLELDAAVTPKSFVLPQNQQYGHRLVLDLYDRETYTPAVKKASGSQDNRDVVIVVDAGHGGDDPGAIGKDGTREKDIVLKIAKELVALINVTPGYRAELTRSSDYFISLRGRTEIARKKQADLFVSIHADAFKNTQANGASVFALSERGATSETARWLATQENESDLVGGISLNDKDPVLQEVLLDLSMTASVSSSLEVGAEVLGQLRKIAALHKPHVEQAGFVVLKSPDIPSILVETGFISNREEAKQLNLESHRKKLAKSIFSGIRSYFERVPPQGTYLAAVKNEKGSYTEHMVSKGETLVSIAFRYDVSVSDIRNANNLSSSVIRIGQKLKIPAAR